MKLKKPFSSVLITGATSGLGYEMSKLAAHVADTVIITGRSQEKIDQVVLQLQKDTTISSCIILSFIYDSTASLLGTALIKYIQQHPPQVFINNAGSGWYGVFADEPLEKSLHTIDVNFTKMVELTHVWLHAVQQKAIASMCPLEKNRLNSRSLCFIASLSAMVPTPGMASYGASKAAIVSFAQALQVELQGKHISVLTVCPGSFTTGFRSYAAHYKTQHAPYEDKIGENSIKTSHAAARLAAKIIKKCIKGSSGTYIPFPWIVLRLAQKIVPAHLVHKIILKKILSLIHR